MRIVLCFAALFIIATVSTAFTQTRITGLPDGNTFIEITGPPGGGGAMAMPGSEPMRPAAPGPDGASLPDADPAARAAFLGAEIKRIERERDFLLIRTGAETPEESRRKRFEANRLFLEINRLTAERLQLRFGGEGAGGR